MIDENAEIELIREAMAARNVTQKDLASRMGWPQSAVSNLLNGRRRLKLEESHRLRNTLGILGEGSGPLEPMPLISEADIGSFDKATLASDRKLPWAFRTSGSRAFAIIGHDERLSVQRFRRFYYVVDPEDRELSKNGIYAIMVTDGHRLVSYKDEPPRFESMWDPAWDGGPQLIGSFPFTLIGAIREFGWRPEVDILIPD